MFLAGFFAFIFTNMNFANADSNDEQTKKFSEAQNFAQQGKIPQAITAYETLILENPLLPEAYNNLAALYLKQNDTKKAKYILEQGLYAHKGYGVLYESLTAINVAMAREAYSKALQIDLKPSAIEIASLSLNEKNSQHKNTIVISDDTSSTQKKNEEPLKIVPTVGEVKRKVVVTKQKQVTQVNNTQALEKMLQAWSAAWSAQAVDIYLSFYHNQYQPSNGLSRKGWVQSRSLRLKKPQWIKVGLSNLVVKQNSGKQAVVNFKQSYQSNTFKDVSKKQLVLLYTDQGWQIFREKNI